jgi:ketosteroid isomerase-like protein
MIFAVGLCAQTATDSDELTRLLKEFLAGASRNDAAVHERFWADDLIYTSAAGRRMGKPEVLRDVQAAAASRSTAPAAMYTGEDIRIHQYGDTAVLAFRLVRRTTAGDGRTDVTNFLNTGTFVRRAGNWKVVAWQATAMPGADR